MKTRTTNQRRKALRIELRRLQGIQLARIDRDPEDLPTIRELSRRIRLIYDELDQLRQHQPA
jgi:hypothetical protein